MNLYTKIFIILFWLLNSNICLSNYAYLGGKLIYDSQHHEAYLVEKKTQKQFRLIHGTFLTPFYLFHQQNLTVKGQPTYTYSISKKNVDGTLNVDWIIQERPFNFENKLARNHILRYQKIISEEKKVIIFFRNKISYLQNKISDNTDEINKAELWCQFDDLLLLIGALKLAKYLKHAPQIVKAIDSLEILSDLPLRYIILSSFFWRGIGYIEPAFRKQPERKENAQAPNFLDQNTKTHLVLMTKDLIEKLKKPLTIDEKTTLLKLRASFSQSETVLEFTEHLLLMVYFLNDLLNQELSEKITNSTWNEHSISSYLQIAFSFFRQDGRMGLKTEFFKNIEQMYLEQISLFKLLIQIHQLRVVIYESNLHPPNINLTSTSEVIYQSSYALENAIIHD